MKILIIILFITYSIFIFVSCSPTSEISIQSIEKVSAADETIDNFTMYSTIGQNTEWKMNAVYFERFPNERRWVAYDVFLETLNENDKNFYSSDSVFVSEITDILIGMGNVKITSPNGFLSTDKIIWDRRIDRIHAPNEIYLKDAHNELWGNNLYTNSNLDYVELINVSGTGETDL